MNEKPSSDRTCPKCGVALAADTLEGLCPACLLALNLATQTQMPDEIGPNGTKKTPPPPKSPPTPEEITSRFPQFEILECLGRGGMGVVYKARQKSLERLVALKIIAPEREKDPQFAERFAREAKTLAQLSHPSIVTVHDFGEANGMFYLVMEFVDGVNLRQLLKERKLSPEEALAIVPPVCEALQYAHQQGVIHRDIKPENLLLDKQGRIKIADFGIAKILGRAGESGQRQVGQMGQRQSVALQGVEGTAPSVPHPDRPALTQDQVIGTPQYMAPEQTASPQKVDHRADIYSLGVVLYEMLTGELPASKLQPPSRKVQVDVRIDEIVLRALEKEPEQRYQTAHQFKTMVETMATPGAKSEVRSPRSAEATQGRPKSEGGQRQLTSVAARQKYNPWETTIIGVGTMFFFVMSFVVWDYSGPFPLPLIVMWALGLGICILSTAGLWPFPSPFFPEPNFSSRNLRRLKGSASSQSATSPPHDAAATRRLRRVRAAFAGTALLALTLIALLFWVQRPRFVDSKTIAADSPNQMFSALGQTWHAMRVFGGDRSFYEFVVQGLGGAVFERWEVPVPYDQLAKNYVLLSRDETSFAKHGSIVWSEDSKRVSFRVHGIEVSGFDTETRKPTKQSNFASIPSSQHPVKSPGGLPASPSEALTFGPVKEVTLTEFNSGDGREALDLDSGSVFAQPWEFDMDLPDGPLAWLGRNGIDLMVDHGPGGAWGVITPGEAGLKLAMVGKEAWNSLRDEELEQLLRTGGIIHLEIMEKAGLKVYLFQPSLRPPLTFVFQTGAGVRGVLQITSYSENPLGVEIRYKLVQKGVDESL